MHVIKFISVGPVKKLCAGVGGGKWRTCAKQHYLTACTNKSGHLTLVSDAGEGQVLSKEVGEEEGRTLADTAY